MGDDFDPYYRWLAIPPEQQPADHYRLLGLKRYESAPDVIEVAADRQMLHIRNFAAGKHAALSQRLLNEISAARLCPLNAQQRAAYDKQLPPGMRSSPRNRRRSLRPLLSRRRPSCKR